MAISLDDFLITNAGPRNRHVNEPGFSTLYVRKPVGRVVNGQAYSKVLDIASAEAVAPGNGAFTALLERLNHKYPEWSIYAECVGNPRLVQYLLRRGFILDEGTLAGAPSLLRPAATA